MGTGDIAFFAALVAVDEAVGVVWAGVGHGDGGGGKGLFELGLEGDGDGEGRAGFLVAVVRVVELALQRRRVGHRAHTRHRPSSPPPLVDLASTVTCHKPREPPRKVSCRSTTILPLQQMAHADHTRDPWCVTNCLRYVVSPFFYSPWVILNDFGGAFSMGAVGGGIWYGIKGARNSPRVCLFVFLFVLHSPPPRANASLAPSPPSKPEPP